MKQYFVILITFYILWFNIMVKINLLISFRGKCEEWLSDCFFLTQMSHFPVYQVNKLQDNKWYFEIMMMMFTFY